MRLPSLRLPLAIAIPAACLAGCLFESESDDRVAGGAQDFPNTVSMGMAASSHLSDQAEWDQFSVIPSRLPTFRDADSLVVDPESPAAVPKAASPSGGVAKTGAARAAALLDTVYWDLADTAALKVARRIHRQETLLKIKEDTLTFRYDAAAGAGGQGTGLLLESKGAELWKATERRQAYRYENRDSAGGFDRAFFLERIPAALPAGFRFRLLELLPGPDGDFAARDDNRPAHYAFARIRLVPGAPADTLEAFDISDADGDGALWGEGDSGLVDFRQITPSPAQRPLVESITQKMRAVLFKEETATYPVSFKETRLDKDGRKTVFSVRGARGGTDSAFAAGDTVTVSLHVEFPPTSKWIEKTSRYRVILSGEPKRYAGNALLRYSLEAVWRKDSLATTRFVFAPDRPLASGDSALTGDLSLDADFGNGHTGLAEGRFENGIIDVTLTEARKDEKLRHFRIHWDAAGKLLKQVRLD